jgi:hypothetical protein
MKEESITNASLRDFLLGKLADEELERVENLYLTDSQTRERVLALEQDLIEDYLENSLSGEDKERFLARYADTDEQRRKLRITKSIKDWAVTQATASPATAATTVSIWSRLRTRLRLQPIVFVPVAVAIALAVVLAIVWLNSQREKKKHFAVEQELALLNSPAGLREFPPQMIPLELRPITVRGAETPTEVNSRSENRIVELFLPWIPKERYPAYRAEVRPPGDGEPFAIPNLQAENDDGAYKIRLRLPPHILRPGSYRIQLTGISNDGSASPPEEYWFSMTE